MEKIRFVAKTGSFRVIAAAFFYIIFVPCASATSYTYRLTNFSGYIKTTCDNCVLNSRDIIGWAMALPGFISISSTTPGAELYVPAKDTDMTATPGAINFNFDAPYGPIEFSNKSANVEYVDDEGNDIGFGPGQGIVSGCQKGSGNCMFVGGGAGTQVIGVFAKATAAPELDPASLVAGITLFLGLMAVAQGGRGRSIG